MPLKCPVCGFDLKREFLESAEYHTCSICGHEISALPFPACFATETRISAADLQREEDESSCFYHESKKASQSCTRCGRFVCALCAAEIGADVLCPGCVVTGEASDQRLQRQRTLYDSVALIVAIAPLATIWFSFIGGPAAIYVALRYWKQPGSLVRRFAWRKWAALALGVAQAGGWAWLIAYFTLHRPMVAR